MNKWENVTEMMSQERQIDFGPYLSYWMHNSPRRMLHSLSYYKFASKMIQTNKRVLDIGCNEGFGTYLLGKECGYAKGIDFDEQAIAVAKRNYKSEFCDFEQKDIFKMQEINIWDAIVSFDVIEHIYPENIDKYWSSIKSFIKEDGLVILGTPSEISQKFASEVSRKGHVNIYSYDRLKKEMEEKFEHVFIFAANDEVVHTGFMPLAHYYIAIGCKKK